MFWNQNVQRSFCFTDFKYINDKNKREKNTSFVNNKEKDNLVYKSISQEDNVNRKSNWKSIYLGLIFIRKEYFELDWLVNVTGK